MPNHAQPIPSSAIAGASAWSLRWRLLTLGLVLGLFATACSDPAGPETTTDRRTAGLEAAQQEATEQEANTSEEVNAGEAVTSTSDGGVGPTVTALPVASVSANASPVNQSHVIGTSSAGAGQSITDPNGNTVTLHQWSLWPAGLDALDPYAVRSAHPIVGSAGRGVPGDRIAVIDVEVCASADQLADQEFFRGRFEPRPTAAQSNDIAVDPMAGYSAAALLLQPTAGRPFEWPDAGACGRGWQALRLAADLYPESHENLLSEPPDFRYVSVSDAPESFGDQTAYVWSDLPATSMRDAETRSSASATQRFDRGSLEDWSVTVLGWTDVPDMADQLTRTGAPFISPPENSRLVAISVEVCAGTQPVLPTFGLAIDGWNLIGQFRQGTPWGRGYSEIRLPNPGDCGLGWLAFAVPAGVTPTGVFVTDVTDATAEWLFWDLEAEQLDQPVETGFPGETELAAAVDACGTGGAPLAMTLTSDLAAPWPFGAEYELVDAVAIEVGPGRIDIHLRDADLTPDAVPITSLGSGQALVATLQNRAGEPVQSGDYRPDGRDDLLATVYAVQGASGGRLLFDTTSVTVTSISDTHVCGSFSAGDGPDAISGAFAAPIWADS